MAQQEGESLLRRVPELDLVMGPQHANRLDTLLSQVEAGQQVVHILEDITTARRSSYGRALPWCPRCAAKQSRLPGHPLGDGRAGGPRLQRNHPPGPIDAYGRDLPGITPEGTSKTPSPICCTTWRSSIRFATSHPRYFTERLIEACCRRCVSTSMCPSKAATTSCSRPCNTARYRRIVEQIRNLMPDAAISADAIVGFPGETDAQFRRTLELVSDLLNTAAYSPRPNTPAAERVEEHVKVERLKELNALSRRKAKACSERYLGRVEEVLAEGINPKDNTQLMGRTRTNRLTFFPTGNHRVGDTVPVRIEQVRAFSLRVCPNPSQRW